MFSNLPAKMAMRKMGVSSNALSLPSLDGVFGAAKPQKLQDPPKRRGTRDPLASDAAAAADPADPAAPAAPAKSWPAWMSVRSLPLTVQPWLAPPPAAIPVAAACPQAGELAPLDRDRRLRVGDGRPAIVVFLRCVGCAFAQQSFLALRTLANRHPCLTCIAVSHASEAATQRWVDLLGGAWDVQVVVDEDRVVYAAWGLGLGGVWHVLNPSTQIQSWKQTGWLGQTVAGYLEQKASRRGTLPSTATEDEAGPTTAMGNKWQQSGAFAVDARGTVRWGRKAARADDVVDLEEAMAALGV